jgi:uracil-DNA glycosylase
VSQNKLDGLLKEVRACRTCEIHLPLGPRPVLRASRSARILIIGQAPGTRVHESGIPWDDASGERLRDWMQIGFGNFYDEKEVAIIPMGFCYPGKGKSGDLPPRPECAELWHEKLLAGLPNLQLRLLIGKYAQDYYLGTKRQPLTQTVQNWKDYLPDYFPLPHPSPRNIRWFKLNPWFESEVIPNLRDKIKHIYQ